MNETRKLELCKNVFNTFLVAWMGAIAYIFANFDKIDNARIMLGFVAIFVISVVIVIVGRTRKLELCKNVFNTFLVACMGAIAYIFVNFDKIDNARIMLGFVAIFVISVLIVIVGGIYVAEYM